MGTGPYSEVAFNTASTFMDTHFEVIPENFVQLDCNGGDENCASNSEDRLKRLRMMGSVIQQHIDTLQCDWSDQMTDAAHAADIQFQTPEGQQDFSLQQGIL